MADYSKQTVAQLRQVLKDRGIPSTGLTRKAQIVEKLEEADAAEDGAQQANDEAVGAKEDAQADEPPTIAAPSDPVKQVQEEPEGDAKHKDAAPGPALSEAGEPPVQPINQDESLAPAFPVATLDANRETISHIDSDVPPPDQTKAIEHAAEDTTMDDEPGTVQPAGVFSAPPADPEDVVGPKITEPTNEEMGGDKDEEAAQDELPDAPGPAAEALRITKQDFAVEENTPTPGIDEEPTIEKAELPTIPEQSTAETSRLNTEERDADSKKRKRRSGSPELPSQDIKAKKRRTSEEPLPKVHLKEDDDVVMEQRRPEEDASVVAEGQEPNDTHDTEVQMIESPTAESDTRPLRKENTDRYKNLAKPDASVAPQDALQDDRPVAPALHPATPALYIRNFMRPLRPESLRTHLASLASPPSGSPDASVVKSLFLDQMKTHALVLLSSTTAASRVRASLHGSIWPPEGNRKELWVDFIPDDSAEDWIKQEEDALAAEKEARAARLPIASKHFEVVYPGNDVAIFQEVGSGSQPPSDAPRGPRGSTDVRRPSQPVPSAPTKDMRQDIEASFKTLDQLFSFTVAKPSLYFKPVSDDISETRLKEINAETSRDWAPGETRKGRGMKAEMKYKYSFDDEDRLVEVGEDRGPWSTDYRGGRGRGGGGFRGRGGGGGGRGRGGGIGWRG
ncbi:hypothetical protein CC86DRAFT_359086 [Ophiobolus disseminans]|uniref:SAP domain-containing protein n=1 Tax=Ophiobolus disseminans TaxID=1469910 RepID=A0A6A6ZM74_9PLEO|nr:hypothetical protein CC86DRAFT_359086 [Ophiobolus disseminans]